MSHHRDELVDDALNAIETTVPDSAADHRQTQCSACLTVIAPPPPGQARTCRCGLLTVTGTEEGALRALTVRPGAGWTATTDPAS